MAKKIRPHTWAKIHSHVLNVSAPNTEVLIAGTPAQRATSPAASATPRTAFHPHDVRIDRRVTSFVNRRRNK